MKFLPILLINAFLFINFSGLSQDVSTVNEIFDNEPLTKVLKVLKYKYKVKIAYDEQLVKKYNVTANIQEASIASCFDQILGAIDLSHILVNDKIVIVPKQEKSDAIKPQNYDFSLSGTVQDGVSGETLPNAVVRIKGTNKGAISNKDGFFTLLHVPNDTVTLTFDYLGYMAKSIQLSPGQSLEGLSISLQSDTEILKDVTITDTYDHTLEVSDNISKVSFNPKSLTTLPSLGEHDLFRTMQLMPGVSGANESSSQLAIRGGLPSQNLVLLDGFTVYHLDHFFGVFSALNPDVIKDVQIYKGGFDAQYGGRVAGVVDITAKTGNRNNAKVSLGANLISIRGTAEVPITEDLSFLIAFRRAFTDIIQSGLYNKLFDISQKNDEVINRPFGNEGLEEVKPDFFFSDLNTKITYKSGPKDIVAMSFYAGIDELTSQIENKNIEQGFEEKFNEVTNWGNTGLSLRWGRQWNKQHFSNLQFSVGSFFIGYDLDQEYTYDTTNVNQVAEDFALNISQENNILDFNLNFDNEVIVNKYLTLDLGLSLVNHEIFFGTLFDRRALTEENSTGSISNLYGTAWLQITPRLKTSIGARLNHHGLNDIVYREPRLSFKYKVSDNVNFKGAYGLYHQFVNQIIYDDPYNGIQNLWAFSNNEGIPVVRSNHYISGFTFNKNEITLDVEAYYKNVKNMVEFDLGSISSQGSNSSDPNLLVGDGRIKGIDFLLRKDSKNHKGWISYSLSKSEQLFDPVNRENFRPSLQDQRHELKVVNIWQYGKWQFSSSWIYGSGRPYQLYDIDYTLENGLVEDFIVTKNQSKIARLPDYHRLDLSATYNFKFQRLNAQVGLSIFNAYARKNIKNRRLNITRLQQIIGTSNQPELTYKDLSLLGFTPSIFLNVKI